MKLYHGTSSPFSLEPGRCLYLSADINEAREYALGLDDLGNYNDESYIYAIDINAEAAVVIEDFAEFDSMGYVDYDNIPEIAYNPETGWYCVKNPRDLTLVEHFKNVI